MVFPLGCVGVAVNWEWKLYLEYDLARVGGEIEKALLLFSLRALRMLSNSLCVVKAKVSKFRGEKGSEIESRVNCERKKGSFVCCADKKGLCVQYRPGRDYATYLYWYDSRNEWAAICVLLLWLWARNHQLILSVRIKRAMIVMTAQPERGD